MQVGHWGKLEKFTVSAKKIYSPYNIQRKISSRWAVHQTYRKKGTSEFLGADLQQFTLSIYLDAANTHVHPWKVMKRWEKYAEQGTVAYLVIGGRKVGKRKWKILSVGEDWNYLYKNGKVIGATLEITFEQY